jgi:hypothetical protein
LNKTESEKQEKEYLSSVEAIDSFKLNLN